MLRKLNQFAYRIDQYVPWRRWRGRVQVDVMLSIVFLAVVLVVLGVNLFKRLDESSRDYGVYLTELASLEKLRNENQQLLAQLDYYNSVEYKLLYARDSLNKVRPGEKLYEISGDIVLYNFSTPPVKLYPELQPIKVWWNLLFGG